MSIFNEKHSGYQNSLHVGNQPIHSRGGTKSRAAKNTNENHNKKFHVDQNNKNKRCKI